MGRRFSFYLLLFIGFLDFVGVGLVFPLFPSLLFDPSVPIVHPETSNAIRGLWMGVLIALSPLIQFFASPILGSLSDQKGRKPMVLIGLAFGVVAFLLGVLGVKFQSIALLFLYRSLFGVSAATMTVVQAAMVDISTKETKARNFSLYNMALGTGFTLGPFLGGLFSNSSLVSWFDLSTPFAMGAVACLVNMILLQYSFKESRVPQEGEKIDLFRGIKQAKVAFTHPHLRITFLALFLFVFGWDFFMEFISVPLKTVYHFSPAWIGNFFAYMGFLYAFSNGFLTPPLISRFPPGKILRVSMLMGGLAILSILLIKNPLYFWGHLPILNLIMAFYWPVAATYISNNADEGSQGEILGIYHSIQALALIVSPLFSGSMVGSIPMMPVMLGGALMLVGGGVFALNYRRASEPLHGSDESV